MIITQDEAEATAELKNLLKVELHSPAQIRLLSQKYKAWQHRQAPTDSDMERRKLNGTRVKPHRPDISAFVLSLRLKVIMQKLVGILASREGRANRPNTPNFYCPVPVPLGVTNLLYFSQFYEIFTCPPALFQLSQLISRRCTV